jgi:hypothetical protein
MTPAGLGATFIADDRKGGTESASPTNSDWFKRFICRCHKPMGDIWILDQALTIWEELLCCQMLMERDWGFLKGNVHGRLKTELTAVSLVGGFAAGLRGEEIVRMDLGAMHKHWNEAMEHPDAPHVPLMLEGRFKLLENNLIPSTNRSVPQTSVRTSTITFRLLLLLESLHSHNTLTCTEE